MIDAGRRTATTPALRARSPRSTSASEEVNRIVARATEAALDAGRLVGVVGGDHAAPFGAIEVLAARHPGLGILHVDAHCDLRHAYEGFTWSHASIMHNVHDRIPGVARIVQVGIRDASEEEIDLVAESQGRLVAPLRSRPRARAPSRAERSPAPRGRIVADLPDEV